MPVLKSWVPLPPGLVDPLASLAAEEIPLHKVFGVGGVAVAVLMKEWLKLTWEWLGESGVKEGRRGVA